MRETLKEVTAIELNTAFYCWEMHVWNADKIYTGTAEKVKFAIIGERIKHIFVQIVLQLKYSRVSEWFILPCYK